MADKGWRYPLDNEGPQHVYPVDDLRPHVMNEDCPCGPQPDKSGTLWVHNSFDHREFGEKDSRVRPQ